MGSTSSGANGAALVTGASRGLGRVIALRLAESGYAVGVNYRRSEADAAEVVGLIEDRGGRARALQADVSSPEIASDLIMRAEQQLGALQVLVCNAGITKDRLLVQMAEEDWAATWDTDLAGPRALCRAAMERMQVRKYGRVVTISSVVGMTGSAGQANYAAAKSALQGLTRGLAIVGAPFEVTVNCIVPGFFDTDATAHLNEKQRQSWLEQVPMGRAGSPDDIASLASFLSTPMASYITGQCIAVDGGYMARSGGGFQS